MDGVPFTLASRETQRLADPGTNWPAKFVSARCHCVETCWRIASTASWMYQARWHVSRVFGLSRNDRLPMGEAAVLKDD